MKKTVFSLMAILAAGAVFADPATENFGKSTVQTQLQVEVKDGVEKVHVIRDNSDPSIITRAYEITVNNTKDASMDYANAVLENWYKASLTTLEAVDESIAARKAEKKAAEAKGTLSSFDTDDFFEAALERSEELYKKIREEAKK